MELVLLRQLFSTGTRMRSALTQRGASTTEFVIVAPLLGLMGMGTLQAGLLYHGKSTLNYATFEAARVGATRHAQPGPMRQELGIRLAALHGGDGTAEKAAAAVARSLIEIDAPVNTDGTLAPPTRLRILNPTMAAFDAWGQKSLEDAGRVVIPNSHLRHQKADARKQQASGVSLVDANLLRIEVTHGVEMKVPLVGKLFGALMAKADPANAVFYNARRFPLTSVATVRMQSEAWRDAVVAANVPPEDPGTPDTTGTSSTVPPNSLVPEGMTGGDGGSDECDGNGVPVTDSALSPSTAGSCAWKPMSSNPGFLSEGGGAGSPPLSSPVKPTSC